uniref:Tectonic-1-3 N-terminal domain-containing protein n=1 Tax=Gadus morhua TaxID=8049 RepID=A0A8C4ZVZ7_GADMO
MSSPCWRRSLHIFMLVCLRLTNAATESRPTTEQTPSGTPTTDGGTFNQTSPAPWGPTTPPHRYSSLAGTQVCPLLSVCLCDLSPELCDIGCCCDVLDCGVSDLNSVFSGCPKKTR